MLHDNKFYAVLQQEFIVSGIRIVPEHLQDLLDDINNNEDISQPPVVLLPVVTKVSNSIKKCITAIHFMYCSHVFIGMIYDYYLLNK